MIEDKKINNKNIKNCFKKYIYILLSVLIIIISALIEKILHYYNMDFREWLKFFIISISLIFLLSGVIKIMLKKSYFKNILNKIFIVFVFFVILSFIFWNYTLFFKSVLVRMIGLSLNEYEVDTIYGKKVVYVDSFFTDTVVEIHDYYNLFFCSYSYVWDSYNGSYEYIDKEKIEETLKRENERYYYYTNVKENNV